MTQPHPAPPAAGVHSFDDFTRLREVVVGRGDHYTELDAGDSAHALFDLSILKDQDPGQAERRFEIAISGHRDGYARSRAISGTKLASLPMAKGDPLRAAAVGHRALDDAGQLTSQRAADDLKELTRFSARHRRLPEAVYLRERISATLKV